MKPTFLPENPSFSSGPCAKRPGWKPSVLKSELLGRSHRSASAKARIREVLRLMRDLLELPEDYRIGITPASDTGAFEMALWSLLGKCGVDVLVWDSFGAGWATDVVNELALPDVNVIEADYGCITDFSQVRSDRDVIFTWNGTTSGVCVPDDAWIEESRTGLTFCDATSAAFAMPLPWEKLDVTTYSWQKVLGGEAQHGVIILSPHAYSRLETWEPKWPIPKIFRMKKNNEPIKGFFDVDTINTPSMLCIEDVLDSLLWAESIGGTEGLIRRNRENFSVIEDWVAKTYWVDFLAASPLIRSTTSVCLSIVDPWFLSLTSSEKEKVVSGMCSLLDEERAAFDIKGYRDAPPGIRIWAGSTIEKDNIVALLPWLEWAFEQSKNIGDQ
ncbi:MAG: phosphoserine transaminase [Rhodospirillaceae bacterium]|nr:phosphoserine transaminase [Rhodospirillaceae bacterium]